MITSTQISIQTSADQMKTFFSELPGVFQKAERKEAITRAEVLASLKEYTKQMFPYSDEFIRSSTAANYPPVSRFIDSIMKQTQTPLFILILALLYLKRLKSFHPGCRGSPGSSHRLLFTSIIIASKYTCDDTYDNNAWATASNGLFSTEETNRMEREMLQYLHFKIFVQRSDWDNHLVSFIHAVKDITRNVPIIYPPQDEYIEIVPPTKPGILRQISSSSTMFDPEEDTNTNPFNYLLNNTTLSSNYATSYYHMQNNSLQNLDHSPTFHDSSHHHPIPSYIPSALRHHSSDHYLSPVSNLPSIQ